MNVGTDFVRQKYNNKKTNGHANGRTPALSLYGIVWYGMVRSGTYSYLPYMMMLLSQVNLIDPVLVVHRTDMHCMYRTNIRSTAGTRYHYHTITYQPALGTAKNTTTTKRVIGSK